MPMTDEQFAQLIQNLSGSREAERTLTRIEERLMNHLENYNKDRLECSKELQRTENVAKAAHTRVDRVIGIGGWTVALTITGLVLTTLFNMWNINEKRFDRLQVNAYAAPQPLVTKGV